MFQIRDFEKKNPTKTKLKKEKMKIKKKKRRKSDAIIEKLDYEEKTRERCEATL